MCGAYKQEGTRRQVREIPGLQADEVDASRWAVAEARREFATKQQLIYLGWCCLDRPKMKTRRSGKSLLVLTRSVRGFETQKPLAREFVGESERLAYSHAHMNPSLASSCTIIIPCIEGRLGFGIEKGVYKDRWEGRRERERNGIKENGEVA